MGYELQFSATAQGTGASSNAGIVSATELAFQFWVTGNTIRNVPTSGVWERFLWIDDYPTESAIKTVLEWTNPSSSSGLFRLGIFNSTFGAYDEPLDGASNPIDVSSVAATDTDYYVVYCHWAPTTGNFPVVVEVYTESGTQIGTTLRDTSGTLPNFPTTAGSGVIVLNPQSREPRAKTWKRLAIYNQALAVGSRTTVPTGSSTGIVALYGNSGGLTGGPSGTSEPDQVSSTPALNLSGSYTWSALAGSSTPMLFHRFQTAGRVRRR